MAQTTVTFSMDAEPARSIVDAKAGRNMSEHELINVDQFLPDYIPLG